ncbi:putative lipoprotein [Streptococcus australis ATCC 700641]|nr:putative lipoprotein [Streptococcus australis ATCC 700641]
MKKWTSLALLALTSASLLVACGSKKEESKSSAKEAQTTIKSSQKKAKASSEKKDTKTAEAGSQEGSQDATNSGQTTKGSSSASTDKVTDSSQMVPEELVGTWTGTTEIAKDFQNDSGCGRNGHYDSKLLSS